MTSDRTQTRDLLTQAPERPKPKLVRSRRSNTAAPTHPIHSLQQTAGNRFVQSRLGIKNGRLRTGSALQSAVRNTNGRSPQPPSTPVEETGQGLVDTERNDSHPPETAEQTPPATETPPDTGSGREQAMRNVQEAVEETARSDKPEFTRSVEITPVSDTAKETEAEQSSMETAVAAQAVAQEARELANQTALQEKGEQAAGELERTAQSVGEADSAAAGVSVEEEIGEAGAAAETGTEPEGRSEGTGPAAVVSQALGKLSAPMADAGMLVSQPVRFAPRPEEDSDEPREAMRGARKRADAEAIASAFIARNAFYVNNLLTLGASAPPRILAIVETAKVGIDTAVAQNIAAVTAQIATIRAGAEAKAQRAIEKIQGRRDATLVAIQATTTKERKRIEASYTAVKNTLGNLENKQLARIDPLYATWDLKYRAVGTEVGNEATAMAQKRAKAWLDKRTGKSTLLDGPLEDNRLEARADAAKKVGQEFKKSLEKEANKQAVKLHQEKPKVLNTVRNAANQSRAALDKHHGTLLEALSQAEANALSQADDTANSLIQSVESSLNSALATLDTQRDAQVNRLTDYGNQQKAALDEKAGVAIESLLTGVEQSVSSFNISLHQFVDNALAMEAPDQAALQPVLAEVQLQTDTLASTLFQQLEEAIQASETAMTAGGEQTVGAVNQLGQSAIAQATAVGDGYSNTVTTLLQKTKSGFTNLEAGYTKTSAETASRAVKGFEAVSAGLSANFTKITQAVEASFEKGRVQLRSGLRKSGLKDLNAKIDEHAKKAADAVKPRWKSVLKWAITIVVIIASVIVTAVTLGAAGPITTILVGALIGGLASAAIKIGHNLVDGKKWYKGVAKEFIVGAIGGAFGGLGGFLAKKVISTGLKIAVDVGIDVIGGIVGDVAGSLAVGEPLNLTSILMGAVVGASIGAGIGIGGALKNKIKLKIRKAPVEPRSTAPTRAPAEPPAPPAAPKAAVPETPAKLPSRPPEPPTPARTRPTGETPLRTPDEAGRRVAKETMEESGEAAARRAKQKPGAGDGEVPRKPIETDEGAKRRAEREAGEEVGEKAAERPVALAAAKQIADANDALNTPIPILLGLLNALKRRFRWIRRFEAHPKGRLGHFSIHMIATKIIIDDLYTDEALGNLVKSAGMGFERAKTIHDYLLDYKYIAYKIVSGRRTVPVVAALPGKQSTWTISGKALWSVPPEGIEKLKRSGLIPSREAEMKAKQLFMENDAKKLFKELDDEAFPRTIRAREPYFQHAEPRLLANIDDISLPIGVWPKEVCPQSCKPLMSALAIIKKKILIAMDKDALNVFLKTGEFRKITLRDIYNQLYEMIKSSQKRYEIFRLPNAPEIQMNQDFYRNVLPSVLDRIDPTIVGQAIKALLKR